MKKIKLLFFLSISLLFSLNSQAQSSKNEKKTVCSVTINSDNEIEQFKKRLSKDLWNFIELTQIEEKEHSENPKSWFTLACEKKIKCDILLVSGHFGGTFFGESEFTLSMEELESNSCNADCDGIINQPKEVFLFGCNTLAGKEKDHRSPEVYMQTLLNDGFSRQQAEQVVAFRYSSFGETFSSRMSQVFANVPLIYGFYSVGPSGKNIEPMVAKYLTNSKSEYTDFVSYIKFQGTEKNQKLFTALKSTALAQTPGINYLDKNWQKSERPYCYMSNEKISRLEKLKYVVKVMLSGRTLNIMPHIKKFIKDFYDSKSATPEELNEIRKVTSSEDVKSDFNKILDLKGDLYLGLKLNTAFIMKALNFKTADQYQNYVQNVLKLNELVTFERKDLLCSLEVEVLSINPNVVNKENWENYIFYQLLGCLKPQNDSILMVLTEILKGNQNPDVSNYIARALGKIKPNQDFVLKALVETLKNDLRTDARRIVASALGSIKPSQEFVLKALVEASKNDLSSDVRSDAVYALVKFNPTQDFVLKSLVDTLESDQSELVRRSAIYALGEIKSSQEFVLKALVDVLKNDKSELVRRSAVRALDEINSSQDFVLKALVEALKIDASEDLRTDVAYTLGKINPNQDFVLKALIEALKNDQDSYVRKAAIFVLIYTKPTQEIALIALVEALNNDKISYVRSDAAQALGEIKPTQDFVLKALVEALREDKNVYVRNAASEAIKKLKSASR